MYDVFNYFHIFQLQFYSTEQAEKNRPKRDLLKRPLEIEEMMAEKGISKNKVKKRLRNPNKNFDAKQKVEYQFCVNGSCSNPRVRLACYELTPYCLVPLLTFSSRSVHFLKLIGYAIYCNFYG